MRAILEAAVAAAGVTLDEGCELVLRQDGVHCATHSSDKWAVLEALGAAYACADQALEVNYALARIPDVPEDVLLALCRHPDGIVRRWLAERMPQSLRVGLALVSDEDWGVRRCLALNPATRTPFLHRLARDENVEVRRKVASNPSTPSEVLEALASDEDPNVRFAAVSNEAMPKARRRGMRNDPDGAVRRRVQELEERDLRRARRKRGRIGQMQEGELEDGNLWSNRFAALADRSEHKEAFRLVEDLSTPPEVLAAIAEAYPESLDLTRFHPDDCEDVREGVVGHRNRTDRARPLAVGR